jgi:hypothetical protein
LSGKSWEIGFTPLRSYGKNDHTSLYIHPITAGAPFTGGSVTLATAYTSPIDVSTHVTMTFLVSDVLAALAGKNTYFGVLGFLPAAP